MLKTMKNTLTRVSLYVLGILSAFLYCERSNSQDPNLQLRSTVFSQIEYSSNFDCGSIDTLEISGNSLSGKTVHWKMADKIGNQYYWFYFKLDNVLNKVVTIKLTDLIGNYRGTIHTVYDNRTQPVYSYDQLHWERISNVHYDEEQHTFVFTQKFAKSMVLIAYAHPYPYSRGEEFVNSLRSKSNITITKLGSAKESRDINLLTITENAVPNEGKKVVLITALQHAGEYPSGFIIEGMVNFLLSNDPVAFETRKETIFKIVPMLNPDGIFHGMTRYNANHEDLNSEWDDDTTDTIHAPVEPEIACIKLWLRDWTKQGNTINMHIDLHSQSQQGDANVMHMPREGMLRDFCTKLNSYFQMRYMAMEFYGSATSVMDTEFHIPTTVFEITQSGIRNESYLTIDDYKTYGEGIVKAFHDYIQSGGNGN
jgi:Zinc carboxypeptidase/Cytosolic carboxypeptidase N-terminal domain